MNWAGQVQGPDAQRFTFRTVNEDKNDGGEKSLGNVGRIPL